MTPHSYSPAPSAALEADDSPTPAGLCKQHPDPGLSHHWYRRRSIFYAASVLGLTLLLVFVLTVRYATTHHGGDPQNDHHLVDRDSCGRSAAEAQSLGCAFDLILLGWVPRRCYNAALATELLHHADWSFYHGPNSTHLVSTDDILAGSWDTAYVQHEFYVMHCTYSWRKVRDAALRGEVLDGYLADSHQTNHCEMMLLRRTELGDTSAMVYNKFVTCPRSRGSDGRFGWYRVVGGEVVYRQP